MKKIINILAAAALAALLLSGCTKREPFYTATENDSPRILNTNFPLFTDGKPGVLTSIVRTTPFEFTLYVTPAQHTHVEWFLDDEKVAEGTDIEMLLQVGTYAGKVVATTTAGKSTSRSFEVIVRPTDADPLVSYLNENRLVAPSATAAIEGVNLTSVKKVYLNNLEVQVVSATDTKIEVKIPDNLAPGEYKVFFEDENGNVNPGWFTQDGTYYQDYTVIVSTDPVIGESSFKGKAGANYTATGINLQHVQSVSVNGQNAAIVSKAFDQLVFTCPDGLEPGSYDVTAQDENGKAVSFNGQEKATLTVTNEVVVWEGSFNVTWDTAFAGVKETLRGMVQVGTIVRGYVTGSGGQGCLATSWWNNIYTGEGDPNRGDVAINGDMVLEYTLTQNSLDLMDAQNGALFVGNGYTITKVTIE